MQEPKKPEYVYLMEAVGGGWVKIGRSSNPFGRIEALQTGCPYPIVLKVCFYCENASEVEGRLHELCKAHRGHGEWFEIDSVTVRAMLSCLGNIAQGKAVWLREEAAKDQWLVELESP
jgi:hypothetical protein